MPNPDANLYSSLRLYVPSQDSASWKIYIYVAWFPRLERLAQGAPVGRSRIVNVIGPQKSGSDSATLTELVAEVSCVVVTPSVTYSSMLVGGVTVVMVDVSQIS